MSIRVLLADDQELLRATFKLLLDATPGIEVVGEAGTGTQAVSRSRELHPDLVLMDIRMPELDGVAATLRITSDPTLTATRVLILTTFETDELVVATIRAGASGFLGKGASPAELIAAITTVASGEALLSPRATTTMIERLRAQPDDEAAVDLHGLAELTTREREIVGLVGRGLSNIDISKNLFISATTAKTHVNRAMMKTGSRDRAQLVVFAYESGLVNRRSD